MSRKIRILPFPAEKASKHMLRAKGGTDYVAHKQVIWNLEGLHRMWKKQIDTASVIGQMLKKDEHSRNCQKFITTVGFLSVVFKSSYN